MQGVACRGRPLERVYLQRVGFWKGFASEGRIGESSDLHRCEQLPKSLILYDEYDDTDLKKGLGNLGSFSSLGENI
jgi:hypothetical protein